MRRLFDRDRQSQHEPRDSWRFAVSSFLGGCLLAITWLGIPASLAAELIDEELIDFDTQIVPIFSKAGCNAASCHGSAAGQGGFRLSLFGGDPEFDYRTVAREFSSRRVNVFKPDKSLLLRKPTMDLDHGGGDVLEPDSWATKTLREWISTGARRSQLRKVIALEVAPNEIVVDSLPASRQLRVLAKFNDGTSREVTAEAVYTSQNEAGLSFSEQGKLRVQEAGRQSGVVKFANRVQLVSVTSPLGTHREPFPDTARKNWIDDEINATLKQLGLAPAEAADDATFLRRVSLDLTGRLASPEQVHAFLADSSKSKRSDLVASLLKSDAFSEYWTYRLATQVRLRVPGVDKEAARAFHQWIRSQVESQVGWKQIARDLILSEGDTHKVGQATVHRFFSTAREEAEYMSEVLMGVRLRCANCHNHPLDQWTQDDYHGLAQIFAGIKRGQTVTYSKTGKVIHPRTGQPARPRIPGARFLDEEPSSNPAEILDPRRQFADWLTEEKQTLFAQAMAGRVWEAMMGRGIVSPVDDLRATNPPTHPVLLERLAQYFVEQEFRIRPLIQLIASSAAYERTSQRPGGFPKDNLYYSYALSKPLEAEVLMDAISDVTGVGMEAAERAVLAVDRAQLASELEFLGQCLPGEGCAGDLEAKRGITSKLHLMNGDLLNKRLANKSGRLQQLLAGNVSTEKIVTEFYRRGLNRPPTEQELAEWVGRIGGLTASSKPANSQELQARCEDFVWALLNCREFSRNH